MVDRNMDIAFRIGVGLGTPPLPPSLKDVEARAKLVNLIDSPLLPDGPISVESFDHLGQRLQEIALRSTDAVPDVGNEVQRLSICLRLWSGCLMAAKTIAFETRSGPNDTGARQRLFTIVIDPLTGRDEVFGAGVESAPAFKRLRDQGYSFDGVPVGSVVRRYPNDRLVP